MQYLNVGMGESVVERRKVITCIYILGVCTIGLALPSYSFAKANGKKVPMSLSPSYFHELITDDEQVYIRKINSMKKPQTKKNFSEFLLTSKSGLEMQAGYEKMQKDYDFRQNHNLNRMAEKYMYVQNNQSLLSDGLNRMVKVEVKNDVRDSIKTAYHRDVLGKKHKKRKSSQVLASANTSTKSESAGGASNDALSSRNTASQAESISMQSASPIALSEIDESDEDSAFESTAIEVSDFFLRAQAGTDINFSESTKTNVRTDVLKGRYNLGFESKIFNSTASYRTNSLDPFDPYKVGEGDEKATVGISKNISPIGASTFTSYGLLKRNLSYGLSKSIVDNLSANVTRNENLVQPALSETVYGMNYSLNF